MRYVIIKIAELLLGLFIGFLVFKFSGNSLQNNLNGIFGIIAGLLSTLVFSIYFENSTTNKKINDLKNDIISLKLLLIKKENYKINLVKLMNDKPTVFDRNDIPKLWLDILWEIDKRFWATTYIKPSDGWERMYTEIGNDIQKAKISGNKADIRRVFIIDNEVEFESLKINMNEQKSFGIKVRYIYINEIKRNSFLESSIKNIKSLDFFILDNKFIGIVLINRRRIIKNAEILKINKENKFYIDFYDNLFNEAKKYENFA